MATLEPGRIIAPLAALLGVATMAWLGLYGFTWNDYEAEALRPVEALVHGHLASFASLAPTYGGSLLLRAPFALLPSLWGGGPLSVYQALAIPCLLAAAALGLWIFDRMRQAGASPLTRWLTLALFVCNPVTLLTLEFGHPEEVLCGCLCIAAVLLAANDRPAWAGLLLGLAIGCKYWPVIAVGPVLLALPGRRWRCLLSAGLGAAALLLPIALLSTRFVSASSAAASTSSAIFQPWQIFWFIGVHGPVVHGLFGAVKPGYRTAPAWVGPISHPLVIAVAFAAAGALWWRRREPRDQGGSGRRRASPWHRFSESPRHRFSESPRHRFSESPRHRFSESPWHRFSDSHAREALLHLDDAMLLLAFTMLLRCLLDTFDNVCYTLPFLFALLAWESHAGASFAAKRPAMLALCASVLCWVSFEWLAQVSTPDVQSAFFLAWTVPLAAAIAVRLYAPRLKARALPALRARSAPSTTS